MQRGVSSLQYNKYSVIQSCDWHADRTDTCTREGRLLGPLPFVRKRKIIVWQGIDQTWHLSKSAGRGAQLRDQHEGRRVISILSWMKGKWESTLSSMAQIESHFGEALQPQFQGAENIQTIQSGLWEKENKTDWTVEVGWNWGVRGIISQLERQTRD